MRMPHRFIALAAAVALAAAAVVAGGQSISGKREEVRRLETELAELDARAGAAAAAHNAALERLQALRQRIATTRRQIVDAKRDAAEARQTLSKRLVAVYVTPEPDLTELVLRSGSLSDAMDARELLNRVAQVDAGTVAAVRRRRARLGALRAELGEARVRADREAEQRRERRDEILRLTAARRQVLSGAQAELRRLVAEEQRRQRALALLRQAQAAGPSAGSYQQTSVAGVGSTGQVFPVAGANRFGDDWLNSRGGGRVHQGIDIFAASGTPLVAVADGTLFRVGYNGLGGWRLWLRDGAGTTYYYAHLSSFSGAASEGARVARGTVIGFVGNSGDAQGTSAHLHFEIHPGGGGPVRPFPIIAGWPRSA